MEFNKPNILVSRCLGFENCRYDGQIINNKFVEALAPFVNYITVCPETQIGLSTPRSPIRIVNQNDNLRLIQPETNRDYTKDIMDFSKDFIKNVGKIDGVILKSKSPSCGIKDAKIYNGGNCKVKPSYNGFFTNELVNSFEDIPMETEVRLSNYKIRDHFLIKLFTLNNFKTVKMYANKDMLKEFHKSNELLFFSYCQKKYMKLKRALLNNEGSELFKEYERLLNELFSSLRNTDSSMLLFINGLEYFAKDLSKDEREFFVDLIKEYREKRVPYTVPLNIVRSHSIRFDDKGIMNQTIFNPYPSQLIDMYDTGKGRDLN